MKRLFAPAVVLSMLILASCQTQLPHLAGLGMELQRNTAHGPRFFARNPINPILSGAPGSWDSQIGNGSALKANGKYYLFYYGSRGSGDDASSIGIAVTSYPFGPWSRSAAGPALVPGPKGSWDEYALRSPKVLRVGDNYVMFYEGRRADSTWRVGLATAVKPEGPWQEYSGNPLPIGDAAEDTHLGSASQSGEKLLLSFSLTDHGQANQMTLVWALATLAEGPWTEVNRLSITSAFDKIETANGQRWSFRMQEFAGLFYQGELDVWARGYYQDRSQDAIYYFFSADMAEWTSHPYSFDPVFAPGGPGQWDGDIHEPAILIDGDQTYLFYSAGAGSPPWRGIGVAVGKFQ